MNVVCYLRLQRNHKKKNGEERKVPRFDAVEIAGNWSPLEKIKNAKGELFFNLIPSEKNETRKQGGTTPEYYLQCRPPKSGSVNFSGIRFINYETEEKRFGSGEPPSTPVLKGGFLNPMWENVRDGFLFVVDKTGEEIEVLIINEGRELIDVSRGQLAAGAFDEKLKELREQAEDFPQREETIQ